MVNERLMNEYLDASGAVPLCLIADANGCFRIKQGRSSSRGCSDEQIFWVDKTVAVALGRAYRAEGEAKTLKAAQAALFRASHRYQVNPSPHTAVVARARIMAVRLDTEIKRLRNVGALKAFNDAYQSRRSMSAARGVGFMTYAAALTRLRRLLIARLANKTGMGMGMTALLKEIFDADGSGQEPCASET